MGDFNWLQVYIAYGFLLTWNVIAMEAAACYIGECANPDHDAKIAMNLEGGYGVFIYTLIPIAFIVVLGAKALADPALADPKTIFVTFASKVFPGIGGEVLNWIIAFMLIIALALSALNAIMGTGRAIYQMALDGEFPTWFTKVNEHGVPARAMAFNVAHPSLSF
jgi:amino acid transporter